MAFPSKKSTFLSESSVARVGLERRDFWAGVRSGGWSAGLFPAVVAPEEAAASAGGGGDADLRGIDRRRWQLAGKRSTEQSDPTVTDKEEDDEMTDLKTFQAQFCQVGSEAHPDCNQIR